MRGWVSGLRVKRRGGEVTSIMDPGGKYPGGKEPMQRARWRKRSYYRRIRCYPLDQVWLFMDLQEAGIELE